MGRVYWDGEEDDGRIIQMPTDDPEVLFQRALTRDMHLHGPGAFAMEDPHPYREGVRLTLGELYDQYAMTLLVIAEIEARAKKAP